MKKFKQGSSHKEPTQDAIEIRYDEIQEGANLSRISPPERVKGMYRSSLRHKFGGEDLVDEVMLGIRDWENGL